MFKISGTVGKIIEYPFDTVKTRLQVQPLNGEVAFNGPIECFRHGFKEEGFRGFYKVILLHVMNFRDFLLHLLDRCLKILCYSWDIVAFKT